MVKKLLKHEFIYYFRTFGLFLPIVLVVAVMARVFKLFDNDNIVSNIAIFSSSAMLSVSCWVLLILSTVISIVRFYKNMFSAEGYLTLSLPVTNTQHIFVKLFVALVCQAVCGLTILAARAISLSGEELVDVFDSFDRYTDISFPMFGVVNSIAFILEIILWIVLGAASTMLLYYACITVGQTAKNNRILKAVGAYFIYYIVTQVIVTVLIIVVTVLGMSNALNGVFEWIANNPITTMHIFFCAGIVISGVMSAAFWLVTQTIMSKKLNLE